MSLTKNDADNNIFDEDSEQTKPLLGDDYARDEDGGDRGSLQPKKLAEYLPTSVQNLGLAQRVFRGLYGQFPRKDVPRVLWVRSRWFG